MLEHTETRKEQLLTEICNVIHEFQKILPKFTRKDSVLYIKYYLGAPLFVQICALFKMILLIAKNTPEYNNPQLENIASDYQKTLDSFKIRCVRERCLSIFVYEKFSIKYFHYYYYGNLERFPDYFNER